MREWLADVSPIIARVAARLEERGEAGALYALLLECLLQIAGQQEQLATLRGTLSDEPPDNTPEAIDQEWQETAVTFTTPDNACGLDQKPTANQLTPLHWVDTATGAVSQTNDSGPARARGM